MPPQAAVTSWLSGYRQKRPDLFAHPLGVHRLTGLVVHGPAANRPHAADLELQRVRFEPADRPYLTVEFDDARQGRMLDLRPALPLVLRGG